MACEIVARRRSHLAQGAAQSRRGAFGIRGSRGHRDSGGSQCAERAGSKHAESSTSRGDHGYQQLLDHLLPFGFTLGPKTASLATNVAKAREARLCWVDRPPETPLPCLKLGR